jgi:hypothetical protein
MTLELSIRLSVCTPKNTWGGTMSDEKFTERLKSAARAHAERLEANGSANAARAKQREAFLLAFYDKTVNLIIPELQSAEKLLAAESQSKIMGLVKKSKDDTQVTLTLHSRQKSAHLIFLADPLALRVRVRFQFTDMADLELMKKLSRDEEFGVEDITNLAIEQLDSIAIQDQIAALVERAF